MAYYMGDFYRGDYYQGDPGLFSFMGRALQFGGRTMGRILGRATGVSTQIMRHPSVGRVAGAVTKVASPVITAVAQHPATAAAVAAIPVAAFAARHMGSSAGAGMARPMAMMPGGAMIPRGFHISKPHAHVAPHLVRNRRMRVTNPKALRRAIRRAHGFARLARKVLSFTSPRAARGRPLFRRKRRVAHRV